MPAAIKLTHQGRNASSNVAMTLPLVAMAPMSMNKLTSQIGDAVDPNAEPSFEQRMQEAKQATITPTVQKKGDVIGLDVVAIVTKVQEMAQKAAEGEGTKIVLARKQEFHQRQTEAANAEEAASVVPTAPVAPAMVATPLVTVPSPVVLELGHAAPSIDV